jgi:hypothetical protein
LLILSIHTVSVLDGSDIFSICATKPIAVLLSMRPSFIGCHPFDGQTSTGDEDWVALARSGLSARIGERFSTTRR